MEQVRVRNPKSDDMGDVIGDLTTLESQFLYDDKDIYLQVVDPEKTFDFTIPGSSGGYYHVLVREWDP